MPAAIATGLGDMVNEPDGMVQAPDEIAEAGRVRRVRLSPYPSC